MKRTRKNTYRLLSLVLCLCMVLTLLPAIAPVIEAEAANVTPNYITDIGIAYASSQSKAKNLVTNNGFTLIDRDLNEDAGGKYIYMGYKTSKDPSRAITGILFRSGKNPPNSVSYGGATFYLVGGSSEGNGTGDGAVDLNKGAGGDYIYTYITRDTNYGYPILWMGASVAVGPDTHVSVPNTSGSVGNVNAGTGDRTIYINYITFENIRAVGGYSSSNSKVYLSCYYLNANGSGTNAYITGQLKNHLDTYYPSVSAQKTVSWNGYSMTLKGWGRNLSVLDPQDQLPYGVYTDNTSSGIPKTFCAVYATDVKVSYDANGGTGAPSAQTQTAKVNGFGVNQTTSFTIPSTVPTNTNGCKYFLGWSTNKNATSAQYTAGQQHIEFKTNTTLYAVWENHHDGNRDNACDLCQTAMTAPTTVNGVYQISNGSQLIWFMQHVNAGNKNASAVLTADINMSGYNWTPIASTGLYYNTTSYPDAGYTGTFDGQGHVISNLSVTGSSSVDGSYGLFGTVSGTVKNVGINNYSFTGGGKDTRVGAVVGQMLNGSRVENCYATNININTQVNTNNGVAGGIAGCNYAGTVSGCYTYNVNITAARLGGIVGDNCGDISSTDRMGTMEKCYTSHIYLRDPSMLGNALSGEAGVSAEWFASGEITWLLNGSSATGVWKQTVGSGLPGFSGSTVYQVLKCDGKTITYSNSSTSPQAHTFVNNICTFCGADAVASVSENGVVTGVYATLNEAIQAVANCTAEDQAVVTILKKIELGDSYQRISSGVFTIDLNGFEISSTSDVCGALYIKGAVTYVTIQGAGENSKITGNYAGIEMNNKATLTITGGTISSDRHGVRADGSTVTISGGTVSGSDGVFANTSTVDISGGTISGDYYGVYASSSTVTVSGGSISGNKRDIDNYESTITLTLGEDGVGATFPGGINVRDTTLNEILGEGAAYWQGNIMVLPADDATEIIGDVVIKSTCPHTASKSHYADLKNGASHSCVCSGCNNIITESHSYTNGLCACGAVSPDAVATVSKNGIVTGAYTTLNDAIQAVKDCTADDEAVITLLQDIALGDGNQEILSGVFTIDLSGHEISSTESLDGALYISGAATNVTIQGTGENSKITGDYAGIKVSGSANATITGGTISGRYGVDGTGYTVTISGGTISGSNYGVSAIFSTVTVNAGTLSGRYGVYAYDSDVTISDGTVSGDIYGVYGYDSVVTISGGSISGGTYAMFVDYNDIVTISGGSISGGYYDIYNSNSNSTISLTLGENGVGAAFPVYINVYNTTLNAMLGEGAAYWQGNTMILPADDAASISGGDVVIKAACKHPGDKTYTNNGDDHSYTCSGCNATVTEGHTYTDGYCICGAVHPDMVASVSKNGVVIGVYTTLNDAIQAVANCTADDEAVVTILKDIALGDGYQTISSGVFTIDLNGFEISNTNATMGVLYLRTDAVNVTIQGAGENSKITGGYAGIELHSATLTINGGTISGRNHAVSTSGGTVTISGGSLIGEYDCVWADFNSTVTISGGTLSCDSYDLITSDSTITLTLGENGVGATFPGGIMVKGTTLNDILGEDAVYCQGNAMVIPADDATEISRGDVVIKAFCDHSGNVNVDDNDCSTNLVCSVCNLIISYSSDHDFDDNGFCVNCGYCQPAVLKDGWYKITNGGNLFWFAQLVNNRTSDANAVLTNDVDLENRDWIPMGNAIAYEGIIDGAGYTVSGLKVSGHHNFAGFIGQLSNGGVKNLTLSGTVDATCGSIGYVGLMVGHMTDSALYNCSVSGSVKALAHTSLYMGGLVGSANHCVIINCSSEADVTLLRGYSDETAYVGGLAGEVKVGNEEPVCLLNSYAVGNITVGTEENPWSGTVHAGGIVGYLRDDAVNNYFYGNIDVHCDGTSNVGYAFGYVQGYSYLSNAMSEADAKGLIISNNYYPDGKTAVGAGKIYVDGAGQSGIDESWTTAVSEANIKATSGENALVYILNSNVPYVERIIEEHLGFLSESEWAAIVENIGGKDFAAQMWVVKNGHPVHDEYSGWTEIDGDWYYYDPDTNTPVTGVTRVPYPAEAINGVTYAPDQESIDYANSKGQTFIDETTGLFIFDENGVFQSNLNGMTSDNRWAVNGCIVWHVGLVQVGEDYYYFIGNSELGGNKMATGDIYAGRNTTDFDMVPGGVYTFGEDGKLCMYEGIVDVNGVLRYYENARLMLGNGLTKVGENYIYVNSKGELIVDAEYYVPGNDLGIASGLYYFDENGYLVEPVSTDKDGVYFENGAWYYYVDDKIAYNQGLISVNTTWYGADGSENDYSGYIYVRSSGKLATGSYYITNVSNDNSGLFIAGQRVVFSDIGIADTPKHGIVDVDGTLYFYQYNRVAYNLGLMEWNGGWIYVRSNGKLATGTYWITNTNGRMDQGMYEFGTDGFMFVSNVEDGIVNENGILNYYLDGKKQYGLGLVQLDENTYIYVRSNGQLATGSYWITNHKGLLSEGVYEFGEDGILTIN